MRSSSLSGRGTWTPAGRRMSPGSEMGRTVRQVQAGLMLRPKLLAPPGPTRSFPWAWQSPAAATPSHGAPRAVSGADVRPGRRLGLHSCPSAPRGPERLGTRFIKDRGLKRRAGDTEPQARLGAWAVGQTTLVFRISCNNHHVLAGLP